jgi:large subunit ribosomal protein L30
MAKIKVTLIKSSIGYAKDQKKTLKSLGLKKLNTSNIHEDCGSTRGMILKVRHLVKVEEINS